MDKHYQDTLPEYGEVVHQWTNHRRKRRIVRLLAAGCLVYGLYSATRIAFNTEKAPSTLSSARLRDDFATCASLQRVPDEQISGARDSNKRWLPSTKPVLIKNATVWTGEPAAGTSPHEARLGKGYAWIKADVLLDRGLIQRVASSISAESLPHDTEVVDANGRQLTSGIVDMHSHAGLGGFANLGDDTNELSSDITPYVRSLDGLDPLHPEIQWIKSGGVTTSLLLPGSGNNMGGEAFVVKLAVGNSSSRPEVSQQDMLADPDRTWRYMKMACGENPKRVYGKVGKSGPFSRLGEAWEFRHALEQATEYVKKQDDWCAAAASVGPESMSTYLPKELRWESLGALLRGQVRLNTHCYTAADLEAFVRHTNEFKFRVRAFHHAHQTYLVPQVLKRAWGGTPAAALFADNMYYKVEAYTGSEEAGKILYEDGITPVYVSDNPVLNSQHVVFEAAKAYTYGLPYHVALAGVTSAPAALLGLGDRVGKVKAGFDADIALWDSDPLSVGAAPVQVWIDGAAQFKDPVLLKKPILPPIKPDTRLATTRGIKENVRDVVFTGVSRILLKDKSTSLKSAASTVIVSNGIISCAGECVKEKEYAVSQKAPVIHLQNGYLSPPFTAFGSGLGLVEIDAESDTQDGKPSTWSRAVDGLLLGGKQVTTAYTHGVTKAISAPNRGNIEGKGVSVGFSTGAKHALEKGAVWKDEVSVHYTLTLDAKSGENTPSISSAIGALRSKLLTAVSSLQKNETDSSAEPFSEASYLLKVVQGQLALVLTVHSADTIASIIRLKTDIESALSKADKKDNKLRIVLLGAAESHLVASSIAASNISVVLAPLLPHAQSWDQRRTLTGAPLTNGTAIDALLDAGVLVAIGVDETWETRELGWLAGWAYRNGEGRVSEKDAFELVGRNLYKMLGIERPGVKLTGQEGELEGGDWVMWEGSPLETGARVRGVSDGERVTIWV